MKLEIQQKIRQTVQGVKDNRPLAGSITNFVTVEFVANTQIAVGGSAAMVYLPDEAEGLAIMGEASYINVGTLLPIYQESVPAMAKKLFESNKPWVLDPVAIGLGKLRSDLLLQMKDYKPSIVRGNPSEIIALAGLWGLEGGMDESHVVGVDSTQKVADAELAAISIADYTGGAVAVSGEVDFVTDGSLSCRSSGGSHFMEKITGAGCSLGGVMAVYLARATSPFIAALSAINAFNLAGGRAQIKAQGPGSFKEAFIDELYHLSPDDISNNRFTVEVDGVEYSCSGGDCTLRRRR